MAKPRSFCAGVERAIRSVEEALDLYGSTVYVLNPIVHNEAVVQGLREKGAVFVRKIDEVPQGAHMLFSAHGVGPDKWEAAQRRALHVIDATCPLVDKVHREAKKFAQNGCSIILIGERGHDEVVGTSAWAPDSIQVAFSEEDIQSLNVPDPDKVAYLTQTTLSVEDSHHLIGALKARFPKIQAPPSEDICYATQNRQRAVNELAPQADLVLVVGDPASANAKRLDAICKKMGKPSHLISSYEMIHPQWLNNVKTILITAGASVPERLVQDVIQYLKNIEPCSVEEREIVHERIHFKLPEL